MLSNLFHRATECLPIRQRERAAGLNDRSNELLQSRRSEHVVSAGEIALLRALRRQMETSPNSRRVRSSKTSDAVNRVFHGSPIASVKATP